jgi:hypothetical protein
MQSGVDLASLKALLELLLRSHGDAIQRTELMADNVIAIREHQEAARMDYDPDVSWYFASRLLAHIFTVSAILSRRLHISRTDQKRRDYGYRLHTRYASVHKRVCHREDVPKTRHYVRC